MPTVTSNHYVLAVPDLERSAEWYARVLGCVRHDVDPGNWVFMARDGVTFMLGRCPDAIPVETLGDHQYFAYLCVDDVDAMHEHARSAGATIQFPPRTADYGMREFALHTIDGHRMMIATRVAHAPPSESGLS